MPCFKGLAVSIHTPDGPLPEHSIQKQARQSRIACFIPIPPPKPNPETSRPEQSSFAISITLLTPGAAVPYSRPQPTPEEPFPRQKTVGGLPGTSLRGNYESVIGPYIPLTPSPNETVAAYIHFDGRAKEEVATLLRRGVETWVNSRWVSVPESEGGGLAEREFLFREVGLERWLNGLDLEGESKDVAARIERRKQRLEKKRRKQMEAKATPSDDDEDEDPITRRPRHVGRNDVLRYGSDKHSPVEKLSGDEGMFSSDSDSDDDVPMAEAAGQIKVSLFRVLASGEIKRGEYSPQFDAHDDDEGMQESNGEVGDADVDHTTTFAKPKTLDPKTISTQTVTGIDPPDKPYATFTFFYRGEKQLQKMGILSTPEVVEEKPAPSKRKSRSIDFASLAPLKAKGTVGFAGYRDPSGASISAKNGRKTADEMDSDPDDDDSVPNGRGKIKEEDDVVEDEGNMASLSAEELKRRAELAEGVKKMQLKRQHSFDKSTGDNTRKQTSLDDSNNPSSDIPASSNLNPTEPISTATPISTPMQPITTTPRLSDAADFSDLVGSPFKRHRASNAADLKAFMSPTVGTTSGTDIGLGIQQDTPAVADHPLAAAAASLPDATPGVTSKEEVKMGDAADEEL